MCCHIWKFIPVENSYKSIEVSQSNIISATIFQSNYFIFSLGQKTNNVTNNYYRYLGTKGG